MRSGRAIAALALGVVVWAALTAADGTQARDRRTIDVLSKRTKVERHHTVRIRVRCVSHSDRFCSGTLKLTTMRTTRFFRGGIPLTPSRGFRIGPGRTRTLRLQGFNYARPKQGQRRRGFAFVKAVVITFPGAEIVRPVKVFFKRRR